MRTMFAGGQKCPEARGWAVGSLVLRGYAGGMIFNPFVQNGRRGCAEPRARSAYARRQERAQDSHMSLPLVLGSAQPRPPSLVYRRFKWGGLLWSIGLRQHCSGLFRIGRLRCLLESRFERVHRFGLVT